jgi:ribosomal protein S18 acetylase RimI-like enzyme
VTAQSTRRAVVPSWPRIRAYRPGDHAAVVELNRYGLAAARVPPGGDAYPGDLDDDAAVYRREGAVLLVGERDGVVVAMGAVVPVHTVVPATGVRTCELRRMRVDPAYQGRGYGRAMLLALEEFAVRYGYGRAVLLTGAEQHPAVDLYRSAGYLECGREQCGPLPQVRLGKDLTQGAVAQPGR